ncbi:nitrate reductase [Pedomonas mirosovicensis]|uniref:nitrate reductase n=1 Tax=Pedomonas mirosovicensis TaxID=2908641 RepID=UPI002169827B|nr:nitrate reductase [Pedomonas mirosovicensis]MCH8686642.1 molybdopterin-dependent oxidoreductase [Pedomonas mirosovicensis]
MAGVHTTCPYCGVGCGIRAEVTGERRAEIRGDEAHPANAGRLCSKGTHLGETVGLEGRLLHPMVAGRQAGWDEALGLVAEGFARTIAEHGPDSVAFYVSGQLLTEDYYVANKLMKGFLGSGNIDTNSRLCMASAVAGHRRAFAEDVVPASYVDLDEADLIVLVGSNTAWCHPVVYQRIMAAREKRGTKLVVIDPRRTETCETADLHLAVKPGSDVRLFNGLIAYLADCGALDEKFIARHVSVPPGFWTRLEEGHDLFDVARDCDVSASDLAKFFSLFAGTPRTVTLFSQGVNQSVNGTDKVNAIINCHLATGRIGKPGAAPFSITGQPNAMGGREVGGLANQLAAHMNFENTGDIDRVRRFWGAPNIARTPGLKAVDLFRAVSEGKIKALWIMATNPLVSLPDANAARDALKKCPLVVVSDCITRTDTLDLAHIALPAAAWGEKDGTVTNSERRISHQRRFFSLPGEARPDWWIVSEVARRMGYGAAFAYTKPAEIFREHARLSAFENDGARLFDIGAYAGISDEEYEALAPFQWPARKGERSDPTRLFADGRFPTSDGRARMVEVAPGEERPADPSWPLLLNSGRLRDQWHTMTRTGLSPRLSRHSPEPTVDVHPKDAESFGLKDRALARVETRYGASLYRVRVSEAQRRGELFAPIHWTDQHSSGGRTGRLAQPLCDPVSGQPGFKATPARIRTVETAWRGFLLTRTVADMASTNYWTRVTLAGGHLYELAGDGDAAALAAQLLPQGGERVEAIDHTRGNARWAVLRDGKLEACLFIASDASLPPRDWLIRQLEEHAAPSPLALLAGRPAKPEPDRGAIVCVCFDVGLKTLVAAIADQRLTSVEAVGSALKAGTNCGSCRPAIAKLLNPEKEASHAV